MLNWDARFWEVWAFSSIHIHPPIKFPPKTKSTCYIKLFRIAFSSWSLSPFLAFIYEVLCVLSFKHIIMSPEGVL